MANAPKPVKVVARLDELHEWPRNYNQGDVGAIYESIVAFGFNGTLRVHERGVVVAGNHALKALRYAKEQGDKPPAHIEVDDDGMWLIPITDVSHLSATEAEAFAVADNRTRDLASQNDEQLAALLTSIKYDDEALFKATGYDEDDLDALLESLAPGDGEGGDGSDGSLLSLADVTVASPKHKPNKGDVWILGEAHTLVVADVMRGAAQWMKYLDPDSGQIFAPYPGPFVPQLLSKDGMPLTFLLVQPNKRIAGHILDRYCDTHGNDAVKLEERAK